MLVNMSPLGGSGPSFLHLRETHAQTSSNDREKIELARKKEARRSNSPTEVASSSCDDWVLDSDDWFKASVTEENLKEDSLYLPKRLTDKIGITSKLRKIVLTDGKDMSWEMELRFDEEVNKFYIARGWRQFCTHIGKREPDYFIFQISKNRETFLLSFSPTESICYGLEKNRYVRRRNIFLMRTLTKDSVKNYRLYIPTSFMKENGLVDHEMITLCGTNGVKMVADLIKESSGRTSIGRGWIKFAKANDLRIHESFTMELFWENNSPLLALSSRCSNRFATLTLTSDSFVNDKLDLPLPFVRENGLEKPCLIFLLGKGDKEKLASLVCESTGIVSLGLGWKEFVIANSLSMGESFTFELLWQKKELLWQKETPLLKLCMPTSGKRRRGECSQDTEYVY